MTNYHLYKSCIHKISSLVVSTTAGLGALLHILSVAPFLECLPGHVLLDVLALLPGGGGALPAGGAGAVLLVHILGDGGRDAATDLLRDLITDFTGSGHIVADLLGDLVALPTGNGGALALRVLLSLDPWHQVTDTPGLLLAVLDRNL